MTTHTHTHTHTHKINSKLVKQTVKKKKYKQEEDLGRIDEQEASGICLPTWSWISICLLFFVFDLGVLGSPPASVKLYQVNMLACKQAERGDPPQFLTVNTSPWFLWAPHVTETKIFSGTKGTSETSFCVCVFSVVSHSLWSHGLQPTRLLCLWDFSGKNTWTGCHSLLQEFFPTQGSNSCILCLLHCRCILYPWATWETLSILLYSCRS